MSIPTSFDQCDSASALTDPISANAESTLASEIVEAATLIVDRGFGVLAVFLLEAQKPLRNVCLHGIWALLPCMHLFGQGQRGERLARLLGSPEAVEALIQSIEALLQAQSSPPARSHRARRVGCKVDDGGRRGA